jgi:hypothetical protein
MLSHFCPLPAWPSRTPRTSSVGSGGRSSDKGAVPTDVFLDDSPDNLWDLSRAGHPFQVLWDAPHNQKAIGLRRVRTFRQFEHIVTRLSEREHTSA